MLGWRHGAHLPSLTGLRAFEAAARHLSFTRAAAELNVTQTAISHLIRRLEDQLGIALFVRRNRALELTREAQAYLPAVRGAFEDLRRATARLRRSERDGLLTVSTTASLAAKWLVTRVAAFQDANPGIEVRITTSSHLVDFARGSGHGGPLRPGQLAGAAHRLADGRGHVPGVQPVAADRRVAAAHPEDLAHHTLLHATVSREDWQLWLTAAGLPVSLATRRGLSFDQSFMAIQAAVEGLGVALGRTRFVEADIAAGRLVVPFDVVLPADAGFYIVAPEATADLPKIALFRDWLIGSVAPGGVAPPPP